MIAAEPEPLEKSPRATRALSPFKSPFVEQGLLAPLKWEPDLLTLWDRAERLMMSERDDAAWPLVQKVIDESRDVLVEVPAGDEQERDNEQAREQDPTRAAGGGNAVAVGPRGVSTWTRYEPLSRAVERRLLALSPETRRRYELYAGGEARAYRAARPDDDATRAEVVRRYFVTRIGADAAWSLALSALDRYDFVTTADLCRRLLDEHPEPSVKRGELILRLVVATAHLGDAKAVEQLEREAATMNRDCGAERTAAVLEYAKTLLGGGGSNLPMNPRWGDASPLSVASGASSASKPSTGTAATSAAAASGESAETGESAASGRAPSPGGSSLFRQLENDRVRSTVGAWLASRLERESVPASSGDPALERLGWNESPATAAARLLQAGNLGAGFDHLFASTDPRLLRQLALRAGWAPVASVVLVEDGIVTRDVGGVTRWRFVGGSVADGSFERVWRAESPSPYAAPAGWLQLPS
ncbi:MAG TPA: hypothetical protein PLV92_21205, partial [Pirellulaceae bacterium]|nr:hypothetical protein [Pirellulaceae bacterium]